MVRHGINGSGAPSAMPPGGPCCRKRHIAGREGRSMKSALEGILAVATSGRLGCYRGLRRLDDIHRFAFHAVCVFSLERIPTIILAFCLYKCKRVLQDEGRKLGEHRPLMVVRGRWKKAIAFQMFLPNSRRLQGMISGSAVMGLASCRRFPTPAGLFPCCIF